MLTPANLFPYQATGIQHILDHPNAMLWLGVGLGKTVISLSAIRLLLAMENITGSLVIAPKRVCELVWRQEADQWTHLKGMRFSLVLGSEGERALALRRPADVYLINYENLKWLALYVLTHFLNKGKPLPFNMVIYDEVTKLKTSTANRSQALNNTHPRAKFRGLWPQFVRHVGLTGEPAANGYVDLHGQYLAVDGGDRLGRNITTYRTQYLTALDYLGRSYTVSKLSRELIHRRIRDITLEMSAEDYLDLPPVVENTIWIDLPPKARELYERMEQEFFMQLENGVEIEAMTEATRGLKCLQVTGGGVYDETGTAQRIHDAKLDALEDLLEELNGEPLLLAYCFRHEADRIAKRFPDAKFLSSHLPGHELEQIIWNWRAGNIRLLCGHPASIGHGLNLGNGSNLAWFGRNWSLELTHQFNGRLAGGHRRKGRVFQHYLLARDTMDVAVHTALANKVTTQQGLKQAIREYRRTRK